MTNRVIREYRNDLKNKSCNLRSCMCNPDMSYEQSVEIKTKQDKAYKKWQFFDNLLKAMDKQKVKK